MPAVERSPFDREDETRGTRRVVAHRVGHHGRDTLLQPHSLGDGHSAERDHGGSAGGENGEPGRRGHQDGSEGHRHFRKASGACATRRGCTTPSATWPC